MEIIVIMKWNYKKITYFILKSVINYAKITENILYNLKYIYFLMTMKGISRWNNYFRESAAGGSRYN